MIEIRMSLVVQLNHSIDQDKLEENALKSPSIINMNFQLLYMRYFRCNLHHSNSRYCIRRRLCWNLLWSAKLRQRVSSYSQLS